MEVFDSTFPQTVTTRVHPFFGVIKNIRKKSEETGFFCDIFQSDHSILNCCEEDGMNIQI